MKIMIMFQETNFFSFQKLVYVLNPYNILIPEIYHTRDQQSINSITLTNSKIVFEIIKHKIECFNKTLELFE